MHTELIKIAEHYGLSSQVDKCVEELGELIVALQKYKQCEADVMDVITEVADVEIMLTQIKYLLGAEGMTTLLEEERDRKIERQIDRINEEGVDNE